MLSCVHTARPGDIWVSYPSCTWLGQGVLGYVVLRAHGLAGGISVCHSACIRLGRGVFGYVISRVYGSSGKYSGMLFFVCTARPGGFWICYSACARLGRTQSLYVILRSHGAAEENFHMSFFVPTGRPRHISMPLPGPIACLAHSQGHVHFVLGLPAQWKMQLLLYCSKPHQGPSLKLFHNICFVCPTSAPDNISIHPAPLPPAPHHFRPLHTTSVRSVTFPSAL